MCIYNSFFNKLHFFNQSAHRKTAIDQIRLIYWLISALIDVLANKAVATSGNDAVWSLWVVLGKGTQLTHILHKTSKYALLGYWNDVLRQKRVTAWCAELMSFLASCCSVLKIDALVVVNNIYYFCLWPNANTVITPCYCSWGVTFSMFVVKVIIYPVCNINEY